MKYSRIEKYHAKEKQKMEDLRWAFKAIVTVIIAGVFVCYLISSIA